MESKFIEVRDRATFTPILALRISRDDGYLASRAGFDHPCVTVVKFNSDVVHTEPADWADRTMLTVHQELEDNWDKYKDGSVLDVEYVLGETQKPKESEEHES